MEIVAIIVAVIGLTGAIVKYLTSIQSQLTEIHVLVNARLTEALERINQLQEALEKADIEIPEGPSGNG